MNLGRLQSLVVNDDLPMSPPPSSFGGFSPIPAIGLFFARWVKPTRHRRPPCSVTGHCGAAMAGLDLRLDLFWIVLPFDEQLKSALEYQAFRHQLIRQQLIRFSC